MNDNLAPTRAALDRAATALDELRQELARRDAERLAKVRLIQSRLGQAQAALRKLHR